MDFTLTKEQELARDLFREFAEKEIRPLAGITDETDCFPGKSIDKMKKLGWLGVPVPRKYGGQGCDMLTYILCIEELSKVCAATGVIVSTHTSLCEESLLNFGTALQKEKFLIPLARGEKLGAFGLTEPNAGTDLAGLQTRAATNTGEYILNGNKIFITNGKEADIYIIFAMTDHTKGTRGMSAFILEKGTPGFSFGIRQKKMGIRGASTCELIFNDCKIPQENILGEEGNGFQIAMRSLDCGRISIAAQALGIAAGAFEKSVDYVKNRKQFGKTISTFQNTQFKIADISTEIAAARLLVYRAAIAKDTKSNFSVEAAMAKLYASEVANRVTSLAVQLHGGYGYMREYEVERMMRDAKITEIYEGTSEVQRMVISRSLL